MLPTYPVMEITTHVSAMDIPMIHAFLSEQSGWAKGIPLATVKKSLQHSLCFGGLIDGKQMAFARVVTDRATFAYVMDVFVLPEWRHQGYCKTLLNNILQHPDLQNLRRILLVSSDARGLYQKFGFTTPLKPETFMEINVPDIYQQSINDPD